MFISGSFPSDWFGIVPIHKKGDKQALKTIVQFPRSLFVVKTSKDFFLTKRLNLSLIMNYTTNQSGFKSGDSCINQLLPIIHEIYKSFDCNLPLDVRGTFSDISKALGKIWFKELIFKFLTFCINGKLLNLMQDYLRSRQQRVVPNG